LNAAGEIYSWNGDRFLVRSGTARDVGAADEVWIIGTDGQVYRRGPNEWMPLGGAGERITAGAGGTAWVVNRAGEIFQWQGGEFRRMPGSAVDIGSNADGQVWIVGTAPRGDQRNRRGNNR